MPKLHLKRTIIALLVGSWFGLQAGYESRKVIDSNPLTKIVFTGKF